MCKVNDVCMIAKWTSHKIQYTGNITLQVNSYSALDCMKDWEPKKSLQLLVGYKLSMTK